MQKFWTMLSFIGVVNRYRELQMENVALYGILIKIICGPSLGWVSFALFSVSLIIWVMAKFLEVQKRRGLWEGMKEFDRRVGEIHLRLSKMEIDYTETKRAVALINNKQVLGAFAQGLKQKQNP